MPRCELGITGLNCWSPCRFGNLATKADWTQVSVDEGLASYLEYPCMEVGSAAQIGGCIVALPCKCMLQCVGLASCLQHPCMEVGGCTTRWQP